VGSVTAQLATHDDVDDVAALAAAQRREYERYQPEFWRQTEDALDHHRAYFHRLVDAEDHLFLVLRAAGQVSGFIIGRLVPAPPVYEPGGLTCLVDDFAVAAPDHWASVGRDLLHAVAEHAGQRGAVQAVVVTPRQDSAKRQALEAAGLAVASEWWLGRIDRLADAP
jgi:GNAT superfamily N-acetyltransferase